MTIFGGVSGRAMLGKGGGSSLGTLTLLGGGWGGGGGGEEGRVEGKGLQGGEGGGEGGGGRRRRRRSRSRIKQKDPNTPRGKALCVPEATHINFSRLHCNHTNTLPYFAGCPKKVAEQNFEGDVRK